VTFGGATDGNEDVGGGFSSGSSRSVAEGIVVDAAGTGVDIVGDGWARPSELTLAVGMSLLVIVCALIVTDGTPLSRWIVAVDVLPPPGTASWAVSLGWLSDVVLLDGVDAAAELPWAGLTAESATLAEVSVVPELDGEVESPSVATARPGVAATASPIPRAAASAPTRPT